MICVVRIDLRGFIEKQEDAQEEQEGMPFFCNALALPLWKTNVIEVLG